MKTKRDDVIDTALALFSQYGYHSVGVDRIKEAAGVSKMTLYKYFPTKEILIENVLLQRDEDFWAGLTQAIAQETAWLSKLQAIFDWHGAWFAREGFHGCLFIKASEEFPDRSATIRRIAQQHKLRIQQLIRQILADAGISDAEALAAHLLIILEGLIVNANMFAAQHSVASSWRYVAELLSHRQPAG